MLKVLYVGSMFEYANKELGRSSDYYLFYLPFKHLSWVKLDVFDWLSLTNKFGKERMNTLLLEKVKRTKPDLVFFSMYRDEFDEGTIREIAKVGKTKTVNYFTNDIWQFDSFSKNWAPNFSWVITDEITALEKYRSIGYNTAIWGHWTVDTYLYKRLNLPYLHDVSFVGQAYGNRKGILRSLTRHGVPVDVYGRGFSNARLSFDKMVKLFNQSKINLNISESSKKFDHMRFIPDFLQPNTIDPNYFQMKARVFEITGCGGFLLTTYGEVLKKYFKLGTEIETYSSFDELLSKAKYYLVNDDKRKKIAEAGYRRTILEHTFEKRFKEIFKQMGLIV